MAGRGLQAAGEAAGETRAAPKRPLWGEGAAEEAGELGVRHIRVAPHWVGHCERSGTFSRRESAASGGAPPGSSWGSARPPARAGMQVR